MGARQGAVRAATLRPGPGALDGNGNPGGQGLQRERGAQAYPADSPPAAGEGIQLRAPTEAPAQEDGGGIPHEDTGQDDTGAWRWGWWSTNTWQSSSSGSGWWDRPERDNGGDDAWSRWNQNRWTPLSNGYGGADHPRPKLARTAAAAALERNLTREEWIEELIAVPPNPAHPEFRAPGSLAKWVHGVFLTYTKLGDAKYRVKMKRASINYEARGATRDYDSRGGRTAAMDPRTARPGGQKRQQRGSDDDGDRGAPVAR